MNLNFFMKNCFLCEIDLDCFEANLALSTKLLALQKVSRNYSLICDFVP